MAPSRLFYKAKYKTPPVVDRANPPQLCCLINLLRRRHFPLSLEKSFYLRMLTSTRFMFYLRYVVEFYVLSPIYCRVHHVLRRHALVCLFLSVISYIYRGLECIQMSIILHHLQSVMIRKCFDALIKQNWCY